MGKALVWILLIPCLSWGHDFTHFKLNEGVDSQSLELMNLETTILDYLLVNSLDIREEILDKWKQKEFDLGQKNYGGFSWQKPMGFFSIELDRDVKPHIDGVHWQVNDSLVIRVQAETFLEHLKDSGKIQIEAKELKAFSRLQFVRQYSYKYLEKNLEKAQQSNFNRLLFSFLLIRNANFIFVDQDSSLIRQDLLDFEVGANAAIPIYGPITFDANLSYKYNTLSQVELYRFGKHFQSPQQEVIRLQIRKDKSKTLVANASIGVDFYNLLKISLLQGEYQYSYTESSESSYVFYQEHITSLLTQEHYLKALRGILHLNTKYANALYLFRESYEKARSRLVSSNFQLLFDRRSESDFTKEYLVVKQGEERQYLYHSSSKEVANENPLSGLFGWLIKIFQKDYLPRYFERAGVDVSYDRDMYKRHFSINFHRSIFVRKLNKKKYQRRLKKFMDQFGENLSTSNALLQQKKLPNYISLNANFQVSPEGIQYFETLTARDVESYIKKNICNKTKRPRSCQYKLGKTFRKYYRASLQDRPWHLTGFLKVLNHYIENYEQLEFFFEGSNIRVSQAAESELDNGVKFRDFYPLPNSPY